MFYSTLLGVQHLFLSQLSFCVIEISFWSRHYVTCRHCHSSSLCDGYVAGLVCIGCPRPVCLVVVVAVCRQDDIVSSQLAVFGWSLWMWKRKWNREFLLSTWPVRISLKMLFCLGGREVSCVRSCPSVVGSSREGWIASVVSWEIGVESYRIVSQPGELRFVALPHEVICTCRMPVLTFCKVCFSSVTLFNAVTVISG